ncbi:activator of HSP90 ATPase [Roseivirga sp. 4D4]|uniref:SRPBCC family protein n=1 Tax=Roseivirga sp. 4D4 TaxID=1889784 RepID=UPI000853BCD7|nr:SRPBCC domain-containing protein [Roseivirga sp. 4D4]OEK00536.1 activator of HSP90 ATPase [Roseivirga sp. 4D4]
MSNNELESRTITMERTLSAPVSLVWEAWTQPDHIAKWWAPKGMEMKIIEHNFTVGGSWKFSMDMPNGNEFISDGAYTEIVPVEKIVTTANFRPMTEGVELHVLLKANGDKTHFTFKVVHPTEEYCKQQEQMGIYNGWGSVFNGLEEHLSTMIS